MGEQILTDPFAFGMQFGNGVAEVDRIPNDDGGDDEIEAISPVALIFERPVADFTESMKEHRPGESVLRLALIEAANERWPQ